MRWSWNKHTILKYKFCLFSIRKALFAPMNFFFFKQEQSDWLLYFWNGGLTHYDLMISEVCLYDLFTLLLRFNGNETHKNTKDANGK